ncbi:MAG TPA: hypothetical protein VFU37_00910 [Pyrinomonadaceae bacterium]|nr:hypothetical protein [Pyrinomonadaceae bacterium]
MDSRIKVIKGGTRSNPNSLASTPGKTERERKRETADTVKSWITEWEERKRSLRKSALTLITCLDQLSQNTKQQVVLN